jgi:LacI family transcriptional regulator
MEKIMAYLADKNATSKTVALMAGVSIATVSRVINNEPNVRDNTRDKVLLVIKLLNYQPNEAAQHMARKRFA